MGPSGRNGGPSVVISAHAADSVRWAGAAIPERTRAATTVMDAPQRQLIEHYEDLAGRRGVRAVARTRAAQQVFPTVGSTLW